MRQFRSSLLLGCIAALGLMMGWTAPAHAAKHVKITTHGNTSHPLVIAMQEMKQYIEEKTGGQYVLDIYPNSKLGTMETCYQGMRLGTVHMVVEGPSNICKFVPAFKIFDLPYLFPNQDIADEILAGPVGRKLLADTSNPSVTMLRFLHYGSRILFTTTPVAKADDLKGKKIRASGSPVHIAALEAFGISSVPMPVTEIYTSLQQGVIDGTDVDIPGQYTNRWYEKANHAFMSRHIYVPHLLMVSTSWWNKLPQDVKKVFEDAADLYCKRSRELLLQNDVDSLNAMKEKGVVVTEMSQEDRDRWVAATKDLYKQFPDIPAELLNSIRAEIAKMEK